MKKACILRHRCRKIVVRLLGVLWWNWTNNATTWNLSVFILYSTRVWGCDLLASGASSLRVRSLRLQASRKRKSQLLVFAHVSQSFVNTCACTLSVFTLGPDKGFGSLPWVRGISLWHGHTYVNDIHSLIPQLPIGWAQGLAFLSEIWPSLDQNFLEKALGGLVCALLRVSLKFVLSDSVVDSPVSLAEWDF